MRLPKLRYRWAAMNPPLTAESDLDDAYTGSQPLDPALADRFAYVVELPALLDLAPEDRLALIRDGGRDVEPLHAAGVAPLVSAAREALAGLAGHEHAWAARYVGELVTPLAEAQLAISGRRAVMLASAIASVRAAALALGRSDRLADCALAALRAGLPQRAQGRHIEAARLGAIHRAAIKTAGEPANGPWRSIRALRDPVARVAEAFRHAGRLDRTEVSDLVTEAFASLTVPRRYLFARHALPRAATLECLTVPAYELLAGPLGSLIDVCAEENVSFQLPRERMPLWQAVSQRASRLARGPEPDAQLANLLLTLVAVEHQDFDVDELLALDREWKELFAPEPAKRKRAA
jgi:hypothetical protein